MVVLEEAGDGELGMQSGFAADPDGGFYVSDGRAGLVRYAHDGRILLRFGRIGGGPGEYRTPSSPHVVDDSTVLLSDVRSRALSEYDRRDGRFRRRGDAVSTVTFIHHDHRGVLIGLVLPDLTFPVYRITSVADTGTRVVELLGPSLEVLQRTGGGLQSLILARGDTVLAGSGLSNKLLLLIADQVVDTLDLPTKHRKGVPVDLAEQLMALERPVDGVGLYSMQLWAVPLGARTGVVHFELKWAGAEQSNPRLNFTMTSMITVLSRDMSMACADLAIPIAPELYPFVATRGDTLLVLDHHDTGDDIQTVVRKFLVETEECDWQPVRRGDGQ